MKGNATLFIPWFLWYVWMQSPCISSKRSILGTDCICICVCAHMYSMFELEGDDSTDGTKSLSKCMIFFVSTHKVEPTQKWSLAQEAL